jgi:hypothetical protein
VVALAGIAGVYLGIGGARAPGLAAGTLPSSVLAGSPAQPGARAVSAATPPGAAGRSRTASAATPPEAAGRTRDTAKPAATAAATGGGRAATPSQSGPRSASTGGAAATRSTQAGGGSAAASARSAVGPLLSSTRYWPVAHQVYPGTPSTATRRALAGFHLSFQAAGPGMEKVTVATNRGGAQSATFRSTDRLYLIEGGMGDDGFGDDTNFGDDAFILTDAEGHIVGN